ncbi:MAG: hypothetical protein IPJ34_00715 [Myxococcales bacterium]|nr:hypothetical protein [Myxococcales bacterium]
MRRRLGWLGAIVVGTVHCSGADFEVGTEIPDTAVDVGVAETGGDTTTGPDTGDTGGLTDSGFDVPVVDSASDSAIVDSAIVDSAIVDSAIVDSAIDTAITDSTITDSTITDSAVTDSVFTDTAIDSAVTDSLVVDADAGCTPFVLGGTNEDVYVDKAVAVGGNGSKACPFKTILAATSLSAPGAGVTRRTIHVKGNLASPDYAESAPVVLGPKITLTSNYDSPTDGNRLGVRIVALGNCAALAGTSAQCAVGLDNGARLERVSVRTPTGAAGHGVLTTVTLPTGAVAAPQIADVLAEQCNEAGFRVFGSADLGPSVQGNANKNGGLVVQRAAAGRGLVNVLAGTGASGSSFSNNSGHGISVFGDYVTTLTDVTTNGNTANGIVIGTPYDTTVKVAHKLSNIQANNNSQDGLRVFTGEVWVIAGPGWINRFNGNKQWGVHTTAGDGSGSAYLVLEQATVVPPGATVAHEAQNNVLGGLRIAQVTPTGSPHFVGSLLANNNGGSGGGTLGYGVLVEVVGSNQPSLTLRGSTMLGNTGAGLRFVRGTTNTLDIGTLATWGAGYNVFGAGSNKNGKAGICYDNVSGANVTQLAEYDRWSIACPLPLGTSSFQLDLGSAACGSNATYAEITFRQTTAPFTSITNCF